MSINTAGTDAGSAPSGNPSCAAGGTKIVFDSTAVDLVSPVTPVQTSHLYVRDLATGTTSLVTVNAAGTGPANSGASRPVVSPDGTKVAFASRATDMGPPNDGDLVVDVFVRDLVAGTTTLVSVNRLGTDAGAMDIGGESAGPVFSPDGHGVAFTSNAIDLVPDLVPGDTGAPDVFLRNLTAGVTRQVSTTSSGVDANGTGSFGPVFSPDGTWIAFESFASNLDPVATDTNRRVDVYAKNLATDATRLASINAAGTAAGNSESTAPLFQPGTSNVVFVSRAADLVTNDANGAVDVYLRDLTTGTTRLLTVNQAGTASANGFSGVPVFNADGTRLAFVSTATDLGAPGRSTSANLYVKDMPDGVTSLVSSGATGDAGNGTSGQARFQPNGSKIVFASSATNLVALDNGPDQDVFLASVAPPPSG